MDLGTQEKTKLKSTISIDPTIFRAYDIRGIVDHNLTEEVVDTIGQGLGSLLIQQGLNEIVIGRDGRLSGPKLAQALCRGLLSAGCHVIDVGMVPTPLLYFATQFYPSRSGIMITGSHNPPNYNGMKIVINGKTYAEKQIKDLYLHIQKNEFELRNGKYEQTDIAEQYLGHVQSTIHLSRRLKVVIDAGNGVAGNIATALYQSLGCEVIPLFCEIDGTFPNHHPDPSQIDNLNDLIAKVLSTKADLGLAFDGDGDRLGVVTNQGKIIFSDRLLMLYAQSVLKNHPQANIIYDVKCTAHLKAAIHQLGGNPIMWKTGHSLIKVKMAEIEAKLAGEMSGHFFFKDRWNGFDDALYAGARLLEILSAQSQSLDEIFNSIPNSINTPELKVPVNDQEKFSLMTALIHQAQFNEAQDISTIDGLRVNFEDGWGLVRPSNTSPYLILRFEALNETILKNIQNLFKDWMLSVKPDLALPF